MIGYSSLQTSIAEAQSEIEQIAQQYLYCYHSVSSSLVSGISLHSLHSFSQCLQTPIKFENELIYILKNIFMNSCFTEITSKNHVGPQVHYILL